MREIKFRGLAADSQEWVYGFFWVTQIATYITANRQTMHEDVQVNPETVGQYTGIKDKTGKEIYKGDLCNRKGFAGSIYEIVWHNGAWQIKNETERAIWHQAFCNGASGAELEVVGNIHENPELIK